MDEIIALFLGWGLVGLGIAAFTESFCSPILPDIILIPLAMAQPEHAIYYGCVATIVSVLGGFIGYGIGHKIGLPAAKKMIPAKYEEKMRIVVENNAKWAIFLASMAPIPYKFVSITAGALKINFPVFLGVSLLGRGKRFLLEGILIYYYGPKAEHIFTQHSNELLFISIGIVGVIAVVGYFVKRFKRNTLPEQG
ncbi:undecaprenyl-diphosphatase [Sporomusaceae bacterium BoRhaA]|uniref:YqaA family protein n=1 Tax=Pelorhabdus rhamnosifermentans TaxID=2772457 RepID=UPI001C063C90|nr:YqaA family protein [Pelorhabdus rhamnosifermentans]MBU2701240.1 undecaprenyl-diphosphatase [Pelorhabdus rhamnosifermentans]